MQFSILITLFSAAQAHHLCGKSEEPQVEQAGPSVIKGCIKETPIYKTHYKHIHGFNTVNTQVKEMVPETKVVKSYRTVERVVKDVVPEFKTVECLRPEYRTVTTQVPYTKSIPYKMKSMVTEALPPKIIDEPKVMETHHSQPCSHNEV
ncbi:hypothetical protein DSO57_1027090 [Entomophthora muscae]|uniref:Uncharacterized protein n=1 Tax=Entomophthora muscae TaxID=34485 RepID=A0ACC2T1Y0_9FUNG|nr:hypothetical protein DSO57_1027090 [Entomophthora muscae]